MIVWTDVAVVDERILNEYKINVTYFIDILNLPL